jgi:hypothetical protein
MMGDLDDIHLITVGVDKAYDTQISVAEMPRALLRHDPGHDWAFRPSPVARPRQARP